MTPPGDDPELRTEKFEQAATDLKVPVLLIRGKLSDVVSPALQSADRVFWIVDDGSSHRGQAAIHRLAEQYPNAVMVHTPVHASWLNQIEIYFSIVQRKALTPNDFTDIDQVIARLAAFETRYNRTARPFKWKFTTAHLDDLPTKLDNHKQPDPTPRSITPTNLRMRPLRWPRPSAQCDKCASLRTPRGYDAWAVPATARCPGWWW